MLRHHLDLSQAVLHVKLVFHHRGYRLQVSSDDLAKSSSSGAEAVRKFLHDLRVDISGRSFG